MRKIIPYRLALKIMLALQLLVVVLHLCVMAGFVPGDIVWGGNATDPAALMLMESISIVVNILLFLVLMMHGGYVRWSLPTKIIQNVLWLFVALFVLNTVGNLAAKSITETLIFTPVTIISALLLARIALEKKEPLP